MSAIILCFIQRIVGAIEKIIVFPAANRRFRHAHAYGNGESLIIFRYRIENSPDRFRLLLLRPGAFKAE